MQLAIQETLLTGQNVVDKFQQAQALGIEGVELDAYELTVRVPEIAEAMAATGVRVAAVNMGQRDGYISPIMPEREAAIGALRQAMADAVDLKAEHVLFVPLFGESKMPDLTPYRAPIELDAEMMVWLLRTVSDLAYAIGVELDMMPVNRDDSSFITRLAHGLHFRRKIKDHPHVKLAANLYHVVREESDWQQTLREHLPNIGYIQLADQNGCLPGAAMDGLAALVDQLGDYQGWLTLAGNPAPGHDLAQCISDLQRAGFPL